MPTRLAVLTDYPEEGWPSMDLCGDMLLAHLPKEGRFAVEATRICPSFRRFAGQGPIVGNWSAAFNADRLLNRLVHFPRHARRRVDRFELFHVVDHSYAQLVHALPAGRTGVYCHDLDAFRCLLEPEAEPRPAWFRAMIGHVLGGLRKAAVVFCSTETYKQRIVDAGIGRPDRVVVVPYGVSEEFSLEGEGDDLPLPLPFNREKRFLLHVGSTIPRKRIDVLLETFAAVRARVPGIRLVQVGGLWTVEQRDRIARLGIGGAITQLRGLERTTLAALYRRANLVLLPSEAEGFGLPLIEAMACGAVVVASDLPVLREVAREAAIYMPVGKVAGWAKAVEDLIEGRLVPIPREDRLRWASRYSWRRHAEVIAGAYHELLSRDPGPRVHG